MLGTNDAEVVTSEPDIDPLMVNWRQFSRGKSIAEVVHNSEDIKGIDESKDESEQTNDREIKMTATQTLENIDRVKRFFEMHGVNHLHMMMNEEIGRVEKMKMKKTKASRHQRLSKIILYYYYLYCLLVYWKKNFTFLLMVPFFVKQITLRELIFVGSNFCKASDFRYFTGIKFNKFRELRLS